MPQKEKDKENRFHKTRRGSTIVDPSAHAFPFWEIQHSFSLLLHSATLPAYASAREKREEERRERERKRGKDQRANAEATAFVYGFLVSVSLSFCEVDIF